MRAVILAGGEGKRLRPLTEKTPKPLVRILTRPCMEYIVALLGHYGYTSAAVTTRYLGQKVRSHFGSSFCGVELEYFEESSPLGTAGSTKACESFLLQDEDSDFLVISGDTVCDFDLNSAAEFHRSSGADVTLLLARNDSPLEYGVVVCDKDGRITRFVEKPGWSQVSSDTVNTGIYIIKKSVLAEIPANGEFDFSNDLFPRLLSSGKRLFGYEAEGYWCDIGSIGSYYNCNTDALRGNFESYLRPGGSFFGYGADLSFVADGARISQGAVVKGSIICSGTVIASGSLVTDCILGVNTVVGEHCMLKGAVTDEDVTFGSDSVALTGSVIGADSTVEDGAYADGSPLPANSVVRRPSLEHKSRDVIYDDDVIVRNPSPAKLLHTGRALANCSNISIGIVSKYGCRRSGVFARLLACAIAAENRNALLFGEGERNFASYAAALFEINCLYISEEKSGITISVFGSDGLPPVRSFERSIEQNLALSYDNKPFPERIGRVTEITTLEDGLMRLLHREMGSVPHLELAIEGSYSAELVRKTLISQGGVVKKDAPLKIELYDGDINICRDGLVLCGFDKLRLLLIRDAVKRGTKEFFLPFEKSGMYTKFIEDEGALLSPYLSHPTDCSDSMARRGYFNELWLTDNIVAAARFIGLFYALDGDVRKLRRELDLLPQIYTAVDSFWSGNTNKASLLKKLYSDKNAVELAGPSEGVNLVFDNGRALVMPKKTGGFKIYSQSFSAEAAEEICDIVCRRISGLDEDANPWR
ncbi:MAG: sugar phosphate nucleotidyltransferase [Firmicutes bacterium]|nr:sugar phosphate nucleotidyltransferase [Bacillota bacterium]